jgi:hypothetical protein
LASNKIETVTTPFHDGMVLVCENCQAKLSKALAATVTVENLADEWRKVIKAELPSLLCGVKVRPMRSSCQSLCVEDRIAVTLTQNHPFKQQTFLVDPATSPAELNQLVKGFFCQLELTDEDL